MSELVSTFNQINFINISSICQECKKSKTKDAIPPDTVCKPTSQPSPQTICQGSWKGTAVKVTALVALLAAVGYGMYWYGAYQAAHKAGAAFEEIISKLANATPQEREQFFSALKKAGEVVSSNMPGQTVPFLNAGSTELAAVPSRFVATINPNISFGGKLAEGFAATILANMPGPNLNISGKVQETVNSYVEPVIESLNGIVTTIKYTGMGLAVTVGTFALGYLMHGAAKLRGAR